MDLKSENKVKLNFITTESLDKISGGWSGINLNIFKYLGEKVELFYIGPISPKSDLIEKVISKLSRILFGKGKFHFFSNKRLKKIDGIIQLIQKKADYNFFFGQTPWVLHKSNLPYFVYLDASFPTYMKVFSEPSFFYQKDLKRIARLEEKWLKEARMIFVGSQWCWDEMLLHYDLKESQKTIIYTGGNIPLPLLDEYKDGLEFVFISLNFIKKGGDVCVDVFKKIKLIHKNAKLTIIGEKPPEEVLNISGVNYVGYLNKSNKEDLIKFNQILSSAFFLIHPSIMDTMGAVLIEAGYFGCPSIAPKSFGMPELILDNYSGCIVDTPFNSDDIANRLLFLIDNKELYFQMRTNSWNYTRNELNWNSVINKIINVIEHQK